MDKNVLIVHYNTPELTDALVRSIKKHTPDSRITIFDNSDTRPFPKVEGVDILDNTKGQLIDFDRFLSMFPERIPSTNDWGSAKHCFTIDFCFRYFEKGFVLLDSDVLVKKDLTELWNPEKIWVGQSHITAKHKVNVPRLYPFCCFINTEMCKKKGIRYFNGEYMWQLTDHPIRSWYDTGAWFLSATRELPFEEIMVTDYIVHYGGGSFRKDKEITPEIWLELNEKLYK